MKESISCQALETVASIVEEVLTQRFEGEFVFEPIVVKPDVDEYGDDYLRILVIFDGDQGRLDPSWTSTMIRRIRPQMNKAGIPQFPNISYIEKSEWKKLEPRYRREGT